MSVTGLSRQPPAGLSEVDWIAGDISDGAFVTAAVTNAQPDVIFHLAAEVTGARSIEAVRPTLASNLVGSVNMLVAATQAGCSRVVLVGSGDEPAAGEAPCSPYAAAKLAQRGYAHMFHELYGTPVTTARVFMTYGPDQPDVSKVVPYVVTSLLHGEAPALSSGVRRCDWVYVDDVVAALLVLAVHPDTIGRSVDVGSGTLHSIREVVETLQRLTGATITPRWGHLPDRPAETEFVADVGSTVELCGWSPTVDLAEGLARTVAWYRSQLN